jgi:hypothetical protein
MSFMSTRDFDALRDVFYSDERKEVCRTGLTVSLELMLPQYTM